MNRRAATRPLLAAGLAVLLVLSGCSAANLDGESSASSDDPPGNTATRTTTANPPPYTGVGLSDSDLPPGVASDGITNATKLARANRDALFETGYVAGFRLRGTVTRDGRTRNTSVAQREVVEPNASSLLYQVKRTVASSRSRMDLWSNGSTTLLRQDVDGNVRYRTVDRSRIMPQIGGVQLVAQYVTPGEYERTNVNRTDDGTFVTYRSTTYAVRPTERMPSPENVSSYRSEVVVDLEGRVRYLAVDISYRRPPGGTVTLHVRYLLRKTGGVQVDRPAWVANASADG